MTMSDQARAEHCAVAGHVVTGTGTGMGLDSVIWSEHCSYCGAVIVTVNGQPMLRDVAPHRFEGEERFEERLVCRQCGQLESAAVHHVSPHAVPGWAAFAGYLSADD